MSRADNDADNSEDNRYQDQIIFWNNVIFRLSRPVDTLQGLANDFRRRDAELHKIVHARPPARLVFESITQNTALFPIRGQPASSNAIISYFGNIFCQMHGATASMRRDGSCWWGASAIDGAQDY